MPRPYAIHRRLRRVTQLYGTSLADPISSGNITATGWKQFRLNGCVTPAIAGGTHRPLGWNHYAAEYELYRVTSAVMKVWVQPTSSQDINLYLLGQVDNDNDEGGSAVTTITATSDMATVLEEKGTIIKRVPRHAHEAWTGLNFQTNPVVLRYNAKKWAAQMDPYGPGQSGSSRRWRGILEGLNYHEIEGEADNFGGWTSTASDPTRIAYGRYNVICNFPGHSPTFNTYIQIDYEVDFARPKPKTTGS